MRIALSVIRAKAMTRPPGYMDDVLAVSEVIGQSIEISAENLKRLKEKYRPPQAENTGECGCCKQIH